MREIKFRFWIKSSKVMIEDININNIFYYKDQVLNDITMQFTGLKDKNGKDIYEGDVINFRANYTNKPCGYMNGIVEINPYKLIIRVGNLEYDASEECEGIDYSSKVVGNIHENPELLAVPTAVL